MTGLPSGWRFPALYYNGNNYVMYMEMTDSTQDYTKAVGEFYDPWSGGTLVIESIENDIVTYSLHCDDNIIVNNGFQQGDNLTAVFDGDYGAFLEIIYMPKDDVWTFGAVTFERKQ